MGGGRSPSDSSRCCFSHVPEALWMLEEFFATLSARLDDRPKMLSPW